MDKKQLRRHMRQQRRSLSPYQQRQAANGLVDQLRRQPLFQRSQHIALYCAADGEIDPARLIRRFPHKTFYLPVILRNQHLAFTRYRSSSRLYKNRFGIVEPVGPRRHPRELDMVLMPLVAFDQQGNRLGMGGGFYDRTFAYLRDNPLRQRPHLIGLAHHLQQADHLPSDPWDIPLAAVATDNNWHPANGQGMMAVSAHH